MANGAVVNAVINAGVAVQHPYPASADVERVRGVFAQSGKHVACLGLQLLNESPAMAPTFSFQLCFADQ